MTDAEKRATDLWKKGTTQYDLRNFKEAIELYKKGYEEAPAPFFLYNIAQAYRQLGDCNNAIFFYKRYLSQARYTAKRDAKVEAQVKDRIKDLEDNCKQTEEIKKRPPEKAMQPDTVRNSGTSGGGTTSPTEGNGTEGGGTTKTDEGTKTEGNKTVASADDDDDDDYENGYTGGGTTVTGAVYHPTKVVGRAEVGTAILGIGSEVDVPAQFSLRLGAGYPMTFGKIGAEFGVLFTLTPVPWDNVDYDESGTAMLTSLLANAGFTYPVIPKLAVRGEIGLGGQFFSGLAAGNPFTLGGASTTGALGVFNIRFGIGAEYAVTDNIVVSAAPIIFSYSPAPANMRDDISSLTRFELMAGVGYKL